VSDEAPTYEDELIGRALDAHDDVRFDVDDDSEVREYLEVLSHMPFDEIAPAPELENRVLDAARAARNPDVPSLVAHRRRTRRIVALGAAAAIAAAVTLVVIADTGKTNNETKVGFVSERSSANAFFKGAHRTIALRDSDHAVVARVVMKGNDGTVYSDSLPETPGITYWFWVIGSNGAVPVAPLDRVTVGNGTFQVHGLMTGVAISSESAGTRPVQPGAIVASGSLG
jgi:hypothetical protein